MKRFASVLISAAFASVAMCAQAADMSGDDRSELRQRAQEFQNQRSRNPDFQPGQARMQPEQAAAKSGKHVAKSRPAAKSKRAATAQKKKGQQKAARKGKSAKNTPRAS